MIEPALVSKPATSNLAFFFGPPLDEGAPSAGGPSCSFFLRISTSPYYKAISSITKQKPDCNCFILVFGHFGTKTISIKTTPVKPERKPPAEREDRPLRAMHTISADISWARDSACNSLKNVLFYPWPAKLTHTLHDQPRTKIMTYAVPGVTSKATKVPTSFHKERKSKSCLTAVFAPIS